MIGHNRLRGKMLLILALVLFLVPLITILLSEGVSGEEGTIDLMPESAHMYFWHPGDVKKIQLYVLNVGMLTDSYLITVTTTDPNWTATLDRWMFHDVPPMGERRFNLTITAPETGQSGDFSEFNLTASSMSANISESLVWRSFMIVERAICVRYEGEGPVELSEDLRATLEVVVENVGDLTSGVSLTPTTHRGKEPVREGVRVSLSADELTLEPGQSANVTVDFEVSRSFPLSSKVEYRTSIRADDVADKSVWDVTYIRWTIPFRFNASMEPLEGTFPALPSVPGTLALNLTQTTNHLRDHTWTVVTEGACLGWEVDPGEEVVTINGTGGVGLDLTVTPPVNASPGDALTLRVQLRCEEVEGWSFNGTYRFAVPEVRLMRLDAEARSSVLDHGSDMELVLTVENLGNVWQPFGVAIFVDGEWQDPEGCWEGGAWNALPPRTSTGIEVSLPLRVTAGRHRLTVELSDGAEVVARDALFFQLREHASLRTVSAGDQGVRVDPNLPPPRCRLELENDGNTVLLLLFNAVVTPQVEGLDVGIEGFHAGQWQRLEPGERLVFEVVLDGRWVDTSRLPVDDGLVVISTFWKGMERTWIEQVGFSVVAPDLEVDAIDVLGEPVVGWNVESFATVSNVGSGSSPATVLALYDDGTGEELERVAVPPIEAGGSAAVPLEFLAEERTMRLRLLVDPEASVIEQGDGHNGYSFSLTATERKKEEGDGQPDLATHTGLAILGLVLLVLALVLLVRRRRTRDN